MVFHRWSRSVGQWPANNSILYLERNIWALFQGNQVSASIMILWFYWCFRFLRTSFSEIFRQCFEATSIRMNVISSRKLYVKTIENCYGWPKSEKNNTSNIYPNFIAKQMNLAKWTSIVYEGMRQQRRHCGQ